MWVHDTAVNILLCSGCMEVSDSTYVGARAYLHIGKGLLPCTVGVPSFAKFSLFLWVQGEGW